MMNNTNSISMQTVLDTWQQENLVNPTENEEIKSFCLSGRKPLALYLRILIGISAFFSVIFFMGFFFAVRIIDFTTNPQQIIFGLVFMVLAIVCARYIRRDESTVSHSFLIQSTLCAMWIGKLLFIMGFSKILKDYMSFDASVTVSLLLATVATYHLYKMSIDNFMSSLATLLFLLITNTDLFGLNSHVDWMFQVSFILQLVVVGFLFLWQRTQKEYMPLAYAIVFSLSFMILYLCLRSIINDPDEGKNYHIIFMNISLILALIGTICYGVRDFKKLLKEPFNVAILSVILLGLTSEPGILLGLFFMILGYLRYEKILLILGMVLLGVFLYFYYYNLELTLLMKSLILASSGLLMFAARGYLSLRKLDKGV